MFPARLKEAGMAGTTYQLTTVNASSDYVDLCVYQTQPDLGVANVMSLAWFAEPAWPTTTVTFEWTIDYSFVWSQTGALVPGVVFRAAQVWPADPSDTVLDQLLFGFNQGAYTFQNGTAVDTPQLGSLYIKELSTIPLKEASVGIGMSGAGTFAVQAQPNQNLVFTPSPQYWVTAGTYEQGVVLDIEQIGNSAPITFPPGVFAMTAILNPDNTWTVSPG
jgi:hypothetical protein